MHSMFGILSVGLAMGLSSVSVYAGDSVVNSGTLTGTVRSMPAKFLPDTVVYLKNVPGNYERKTVAMDQQRMLFIPRVLAVVAGDTVGFTNHDPMAHNVFSPDNEKYDLGSMRQNETRNYVFAKEGTYTQLCNLHPDMIAYIFVGQNPFQSVVDANGGFSIVNVPAGTYDLAVWNPRLKGSSVRVTITDGGTTSSSLSIHR